MPNYQPLTEGQYRHIGVAITEVIEAVEPRDSLIVDYHLAAAAVRLVVAATIADLDPGKSLSPALIADINRTAEDRSKYGSRRSCERSLLILGRT